jgi:hypothetical protein
VSDQDAKEDEITVQVCLFAFDLLYLNGKVHTRVLPSLFSDGKPSHSGCRGGICRAVVALFCAAVVVCFHFFPGGETVFIHCMIGFACNGVGRIRQPYIREPLAERRTALREHFVAVEDVFQWAKAWDADNVDKIQEFLDESIKGKALRRGAVRAIHSSWLRHHSLLSFSAYVHFDDGRLDVWFAVGFCTAHHYLSLPTYILLTAY